MKSSLVQLMGKITLCLIVCMALLAPHVAYMQGMGAVPAIDLTNYNRPIQIPTPADTLRNEGCTSHGFTPRTDDAPEGQIRVRTYSGEIFDCPIETYEKVTKKDPEADGENMMTRFMIKIIHGFLAVVAQVGIIILGMATKTLAAMVGVGQFITNDMVQGGWPFIQGIVNLGFILALLFIAISTVLRIDDLSIKRLLPRLLIGALLINFSLIIGGLLIDVSRIVMAIEVNMLADSGGETLERRLSKGILENSGIIATQTKLNTFDTGKAIEEGRQGGFIVDGDAWLPVASSIGGWSSVVNALISVIFLWSFALALVTIALVLLWRYVILIMLLIISPLPYLAIAMPKAEFLAKMWWSQFIKWVLAGPIAVFVLVLLVQLGHSSISKINEGGLFGNLLQLVLVIAVLLVSAVAATKFGGAGAAGAINMAKRGGRAAVRNPVKTAAIGAGVATAGAAPAAAAALGAGALGILGARGAKRGAKDAWKRTGDNMRKGDVFGRDTFASKAAKWAAGGHRDDKGNLKEGEETLATKAVDYATGRSKREAEGKAAAEGILAQPRKEDPMAAMTGRPTIDPTNSAFSADNLKYDEAVKALSQDQISAIINQNDNSKISVLVNSEEFAKKLNTKEGQDNEVNLLNKLSSTISSTSASQNEKNAATRALRDFNKARGKVSGKPKESGGNQS